MFSSTVEEHGSGHQLFRIHAWPQVSGSALLASALLASAAVVAATQAALAAAAILGGLAALISWRTWRECCSALSAIRDLDAWQRVDANTPSSTLQADRRLS